MQDIYFDAKYAGLYQKLGEGEVKKFVFSKNGFTATYSFLMNKVNDLNFVLDKDYYDIQCVYG